MKNGPMSNSETGVSCVQHGHTARLYMKFICNKCG